MRGYHKPIMLAGGLGSIREGQIHKESIAPGTAVFVLGGPAMLIGLGGGAASSVASGKSAENLDFASVQRGNPEMQRRCQEVIDRCWAMGKDNPIVSIHDVGAGGLSNAIPELLNDSERGGRMELRTIPNDELGMSPMEIWCNEAQERYVMAVSADKQALFEFICERERCPVAMVGEATEDPQLVVGDGYFNNLPVNLPMSLLLGKPPKMLREAHHHSFHKEEFDTSQIVLADAIHRVLRLPAVANKSFLISIGDRSVTGLVSRDQMVGPWQVPVSDVAVTTTDFVGHSGEAMALGERTPVAIINGPASGRLAVGEAITNLAAARIEKISDITLSANWMAAIGHGADDAALYETVKAVGEELCPALGICIPVGKDSMSMKTIWHDAGEQKAVTAPVSLIVTGFAPVVDVRKTLTPQIQTEEGDSDLILIDLGKGKNRLGGSCLAQVYRQVGQHSADLDDPAQLCAFFDFIQRMNQERKLLAYHDRSDGGLLATLCEMAFAAHQGLDIQLEAGLQEGHANQDPIALVFTEELGAVIQVRHADVDEVLEELHRAGLAQHSHLIGQRNADDMIRIFHGSQCLFAESRVSLQRTWSEVSYQMQKLRDNPDCAQQEFDGLLDAQNPGLRPKITFDPSENICAPFINKGVKPRVAILREQGVNGQIEMAAAFHRAEFDAVDVHMSDLVQGRVGLSSFQGIVACGGFSFGDVLGAGQGWAKSILFNEKARAEFEIFFQRPDTFGLGVCNGCQMLSNLKELIPGAAHWPLFVRNLSDQFEARFAMLEILPSKSLFFAGMEGSHLPIAVAHGEGYAQFAQSSQLATLQEQQMLSACFVDHYGRPTEQYPLNPNGSLGGATAFCNQDGRFTIMMPHPERVFRTLQHSWHPKEWQADGPWLRMFRNARTWVA